MLDSYITDTCVEELYHDIEELEWRLLVSSWSEETYSSELDERH